MGDYLKSPSRQNNPESDDMMLELSESHSMSTAYPTNVDMNQANSSSDQPFFSGETASFGYQDNVSQPAPIVVELNGNHFDLDSYSSQYYGYTRVARLKFIAERCPDIENEAWRLCLSTLRDQTTDTTSFSDIISTLKSSGKFDLIPSDACNWISETEKKNNEALDLLEQDLESARKNVIRESTRMAYTEMGDHYFCRGDLKSALQHYFLTKDFCASSNHVAKMCLDIIKVAINSKLFGIVSKHVDMAEHTGAGPKVKATLAQPTQTTAATKPVRGSVSSPASTGEGGDPEALAFLRAVSGLVLLEGGRYKDAAKKFVSVGFDMAQPEKSLPTGAIKSPSKGTGGRVALNAPMVVPDISLSAGVISPRDVALYGGLCSLASFDRTEFKRFVIDNAGFKLFLELYPDIRELLNDFYRSKYQSALQLLGKIHPFAMLDIHLSLHTETLFTLIRRKALIQYVQPFSTVKLQVMASVMATDILALEKELVALIVDEQIHGRIDSHLKILHFSRLGGASNSANSQNRTSAFRSVLMVGNKTLVNTETLCRRVDVLRYKYGLDGPKSASVSN